MVSQKRNVMKTRNYFELLLVTSFLCLTFFGGCRKGNNGQPYRYQIVTPVLMEKSEYFQSINGNASEPINNGGRIYMTDKYIFVNEVDKGIHIIDNTNPVLPHQVAFLNIPGNQGMVVKGNTLLADMYGNLLSIDITDLKNAKVSNMISRFFTARDNGSFSVDDDHVVVGYTQKDTVVYLNIEQQCAACENMMYATPQAAGNNRQSGQAGSMAGMILMDNYLYAITEPHSVGIIDVSEPKVPLMKQSFFAGFDLETIFPFGDNLFLGSKSGMFIYDVSSPEEPVKLGEFSHGRACDPVVADGNTAYVTLHAGTSCGGDANELNVIDISDLMQPKLIRSYAMTGPQGLCKDGDLLFVCDGDEVKVFDATDAAAIVLKHTIPVKNTYDVIAHGGLLIVVAKDGIYQYDYTAISNIHQLSEFKVPVHVK